MIDLAPRIAEIARLILGMENRKLSTKTELRFGTNGSVAVKITGDKAGTWYDHENCEGGGAHELIRCKLGLVDGQANEWLTDNLGSESEKKTESGFLEIYDYRDEAGKLRFQVCRKPKKGGFPQRRPDGVGGWIWNLDGVERVPYRLPELLAAVAAGETIYIAEGEKGVEALRRAGLAATCSPGGAGKWPPQQFQQYFRGADVVVLPDNDDAGRSHGNDVVCDLLGIARVRVLDLAQHHDNFPPKADPFDWFALGRSVEDLTWILEGVDPLATPSNEDSNPEPAAPKRPCLALADWLTRDLPEPDFLMGEVFSTSSRGLLVADTGLGKTNFGLALALDMAAGEDFLHWRCRRPARILFIDGEMSTRLIKRRLIDAARRAGNSPSGFFILNGDDYPDMPPLNTPDGQAFIDNIIEQIGGVDFIIFDNIQALLLGDMREEEPWQQTLPWVHKLTRRNIGQLWVHHTGHDTTHSYGTKTREWQMDAVIMLSKIESDADLAFALSFNKARERAPDNRADFADMTVTLDNEWSAVSTAAGPATAAPAAPKPPSPKGVKFHDALVDALARSGAVNAYSAGNPAVTMLEWEAEARRLGLILEDTKPNSIRSQLSKYRLELIAANWIACTGDYAWSLKAR